ncbi:hypothetical protein A0H81_09449 [Grifola frondosa]|uniref:Uncharacterized protein n=1 Tax=Grifola frondosa TaxID=5627 RepID=A0A1C7M0U4_GRIFR|nr:hypothetical protein A0H81_09449 [Grifola frondosa]
MTELTFPRSYANTGSVALTPSGVCLHIMSGAGVLEGWSHYMSRARSEGECADAATYLLETP